jgi:hypothetical protein
MHDFQMDDDILGAQSDVLVVRFDDLKFALQARRWASGEVAEIFPSRKALLAWGRVG